MRRFILEKRYEHRFNDDGSFIWFFDDWKLEDTFSPAVGKLTKGMIESLRSAWFIEVKEEIK